MSQLDSIANRIREQHKLALIGAKKTVDAMIACGALLREAQAKCVHGEWRNFLASVEISDRTFRRYRDLSIAHEAAKKKGMVLPDGVTMVDIFRSYGLVKEHEPGGYKSSNYKDRKTEALANELGQVEFNFEDGYRPVIRGLLHSNKVEELGEATLRVIHRDLLAAKKRVEALLAEKGAINLENHQP